MTWPKSLSGSSAAICDLPWPCAAATSRRTCCPGVMPSVHTPGCACDGSLVKASTATLACRAIGATAAVSCRGQRPQDQSCAIRNGSPGGGCGTFRRAAGILGIQRRRAGHVDRKLSGLQHGLADIGMRARQRQQDRDTLAGRAGRRWRAWRSGGEGDRRATVTGWAIAVSAATARASATVPRRSTNARRSMRRIS